MQSTVPAQPGISSLWQASASASPLALLCCSWLQLESQIESDGRPALTPSTPQIVARNGSSRFPRCRPWHTPTVSTASRRPGSKNNNRLGRFNNQTPSVSDRSLPVLFADNPERLIQQLRKAHSIIACCANANPSRHHRIAFGYMGSQPRIVLMPVWDRDISNPPSGCSRSRTHPRRLQSA